MDYSKIARYVWVGQRDKFWYQDCQQVLTEIFGEEDLLVVSKLLAATSINSSLKANIRLFRKAYHELKNGLPFSNYLPVMKQQLEYVRNGEPLSGRKINNFADAMAGRESAVVVDIWIQRAFNVDRRYYHKDDVNKTGTFRSSGPTNNTYTKIEDWTVENAKIMGLQPRELNAMIWSGVRTEFTGKRNTTRYSDLIRCMFSKTLF